MNSPHRDEKRRRRDDEDRVREEEPAPVSTFQSRVIAPPENKKMDLNMSADDVFARRAAMSRQPSVPASGSSSNGGNWGFAMPKAGPADEPVAKRQKAVQERGEAPSRVVLLRNMVGRGEVDVDLRQEISEECMK
jgi:hypothetical protein